MEERAVLKAIPYQANQRGAAHGRAAAAAPPPRLGGWNFFSPRRELSDEPVSLSYLINRLQPLPFRRPWWSR